MPNSTDIHRYRVAIMDPNPMYGKSEVLKTFVNCADAIAYAKKVCKTRTNVYVEDRIYVSQANVERDFAFNAHIVAADWLGGVYALTP